VLRIGVPSVLCLRLRSLFQPDEVAFTTMISASALGYGAERAYNLWEEMEQLGLAPTFVTYQVQPLLPCGVSMASVLLLVSCPCQVVLHSISSLLLWAPLSLLPKMQHMPTRPPLSCEFRRCFTRTRSEVTLRTRRLLYSTG
jgi:hypothetical protein